MNNTTELLPVMLAYQRIEITEYNIYRKLALIEKSQGNREVLERIAADELRHADFWRQHTGKDIGPDRWKVRFYYWISRLLGLTFGIKMMERGENVAQANYGSLEGVVAGVEDLTADENDHESKLLDMLDEERLHYMGSVVLGLNDALVELTGGLAGLTLALGDTRLIALSGLIVGIAAAMSMAASEYLSTKEDAGEKEPVKSSVYTGVAYTATVSVLIAPYLLFENPYVCLGWTLSAAVLIIAAFNYYISVANDRPFRKHFLEMASVSLGVAVLSFGVGYIVRAFLGVDV